MIEAAALDLDGTLLNSEQVWYEIHRDVFRTYGIIITPKLYKECWIKTNKGAAGLCKEFGIPLEEIRAQKRTKWEERKMDVQLMPGAQELIERLYQNFRLAVVSSSYRQSVQTALREILRAEDKIEVVVAYEDITNTKPDPEPYRKGRMLLGLQPHQCIAIEDAEKGVISATEDGLHCIAVPNEWTSDGDFSRADAVVKSLNDITLEMIEEISNKP